VNAEDIRKEVKETVNQLHACYEGHVVPCGLLGRRVDEAIDLTMRRTAKAMIEEAEDLMAVIAEVNPDRDIRGTKGWAIFMSKWLRPEE